MTPAASQNGGAPQRESRALDLGALAAPVCVDAGVEQVTLDVRRNGQAIGNAIVVPSREGIVGTDRLRDTVIDQLAPALMLSSWEASVEMTRQFLQANLLRVPKG